MLLTEKLSIDRDNAQKQGQVKPGNPKFKANEQYPQDQMRFTSDGRPICAQCSKIGHRWRQCRMRKAQMAQATQPAQPSHKLPTPLN